MNSKLVNQNLIKSGNLTQYLACFLVQYLLKGYMLLHLVCAFKCQSMNRLGMYGYCFKAFAVFSAFYAVIIVFSRQCVKLKMCLETACILFHSVFFVAVFLNKQSSLGGVWWTQLYGASVKLNSCSDNPCIFALP